MRAPEAGDASGAARVVARVDALLEAHRAELGADFSGYRNHCARMASFCLAFLPEPSVFEERVAIAAAFHDLGIWTARTWDYLPPSCALAREHLERTGRTDRADEIVATIADHHKVTPSRAGGSSPLVEAFRKADLVDVSFGLVRFGLSGAFVRSVRGAYPNAGFHAKLVHLGAAALVRTPLRPLPMMKL